MSSGVLKTYRLLDFHATWCEPCKWSEPVVEDVLGRLGGSVVLEKIDIDREPARAAAYGIRSVPTFILLDGEAEVWRMNGFDTPGKMTAAIETAINTRK
jgi:thioredoxin 1